MSCNRIDSRRVAAVAVAATLIGGAWCVRSEAETLPGSGRAAPQLAASAVGEVVPGAVAIGTEQERVIEQLRRVSSPIVREAIRMRPETSSWQWQVRYFHDQELVVHAHPGGVIDIHAGLMERLQLTDDELAQVLAHALGSVIGADRRQIAVAAADREATTVAALFDDGVSAIPMLLARLSPEHAMAALDESDTADRVGLEIAARAGFDPRAAVSVIEKLRRIPDSARGAIGVTDESRLRGIRRVLPEMLELYRAQQRRMIALL